MRGFGHDVLLWPGVAHVADDCPVELLGQAEVKAGRLVEFLVEHAGRAARRRHPRLVSAHEVWERRGKR